MIDPQKSLKIKLIDFGFSTLFESPTNLFEDIVGTQVYMAPEIHTNKYGIEVDMWAAGISLFILLFRRHPTFIRNKLYLPELICLKKDNTQLSLNRRQVLCHMLTYNPKERMTTKQFFQHP